MNELKTGNFIVSFIDLLGAKEGMKTDSNGMLIKVHDAYKESIDAYKEMFGSYPEDVNYRIFSDNIIVFCQYESVDISEAFKVIVLLSSLIQIQFMLKDYIVRGGISTGDFYFDDVMVWGNALSKAYYIESKLSVYPRIVIERELIDTIKEKTKDNIELEDFNNDFIKMDNDGLYYVDYYHRLSKVSESVTYNVICKRAYNNMMQYYDNSRIFAKWHWHYNQLCRYMASEKE